MFRSSKSDDPPERRDSEDEPADMASPEGSGNSVASSALRWLTGSGRPGPSADQETEAAATDEDDDMSEIFELTEPLDPDDPEGDDEQEAAEPSPETEPERPEKPVRAEIHSNRTAETGSDGTQDVAAGDRTDEVGSLSLLECDDEDDIDDFDDIPGLASPVPFATTTFFPDVDDIAAPDSLDRPEAAETPADRWADDPRTNDPRPDTAIQTSKPSGRGEADSAGEIGEMPAARRSAGRLDEAPSAPADTSLALQPIPELQAGARSPSRTDDDAMAPDDDRMNDDDVEIPWTDDDIPDVDVLDADGTQIDSLGVEATNESDDAIGDDWHAHLADVLGGDGQLDDGPPPESVMTRPARQPEDDPAPMIPVSTTLTRMAAGMHDEDEDDVPELPVLTRAARQKPVSADTNELSHVQLSLGIIANIPRLRRFAAAQIGHEPVADRLVQGTVESALADPAALQPAGDLGQALISLLYQYRQQMLDERSAIDRSPEEARTFETVLCRGLAGADQFEIHQFAKAINGLDEHDRELLIMVALENLAYDQIADMIQVPRERVMAMVSNARMRLRQALTTDDLNGGEIPDVFTPHPQEVEIHGYLDGELDGHHMAQIDALVEQDEDAADRLLNYGIQGDLVRRLYAPLLNRPIPGKMLDAASAAAKPPKRGFRFGPRRALLAGAIIVVFGCGAAWSNAMPAFDGLVSDAVAASPAKIER